MSVTQTTTNYDNETLFLITDINRLAVRDRKNANLTQNVQQTYQNFEAFLKQYKEEFEVFREQLNVERTARIAAEEKLKILTETGQAERKALNDRIDTLQNALQLQRVEFENELKLQKQQLDSQNKKIEGLIQKFNNHIDRYNSHGHTMRDGYTGRIDNKDRLSEHYTYDL